MRQTGPGTWQKLFTAFGSKCSPQLFRCTRLTALKWLLSPENCCSILTQSSNLLKRSRLSIDGCSKLADFVCSWTTLRNFIRNSSRHKVTPAIRLLMGRITSHWFYASGNGQARCRAEDRCSLGRASERRGTSTKKTSSTSPLFRSKRKKKSGLTTQMESANKLTRHAIQLCLHRKSVMMTTLTIYLKASRLNRVMLMILGKRSQSKLVMCLVSSTRLRLKIGLAKY
jgi:hypothetical protein